MQLKVTRRRAFSHWHWWFLGDFESPFGWSGAMLHRKFGLGPIGRLETDKRSHRVSGARIQQKVTHRRVLVVWYRSS